MGPGGRGQPRAGGEGVDGVTERATRRELRIGGRTGGGQADGAVLITGGAGFIGTNVAHQLLGAGTPVIVLDNLSRPGVERNLRWLRDTHGPLLRIEIGDVRDRATVQRVVTNVRQVIHLAAQVAVTTSVLDPLQDFEVNARGTLNLLSALNTLDEPPPLLFTSTNKVYGSLEDIALHAEGARYTPESEQIRREGIDESRRLDFHSPYGCSKGAADQYVLDYARTFGLRTVVFRMSCVYGPHQFGTEDQGWVAHFLIHALRGEPLTFYGDGRQVRDVLYVDDLVRAIRVALDNIDALAGQAFNIGGGPANTASLLELLQMIRDLGAQPVIRYKAWRPGDQRFYVSNVGRFAGLTGWRPQVAVADGVRRLRDWLLHAGVLSARTRDAHAAWELELAAPAAAVGE
jgi:CDP-paratose 2-epimerase